MNNPRKLFAFSLSNLNRLGCLSEKKQSSILLLMVNITMGTVFLNIILLIVQFFYMHGNIEEYVSNCAGIAGLFQGFAKWFFCLYYRNKFIKLIKYTDYFWNENECSNITKSNIAKISKNAVLIQKLFTGLTIIVVFLGCIESVCTKQFVIGYWSMGNKNLLFTIAWISMLININLLSLVIPSCDGMFVGFCYEEIIQCKILCDRLDQLSIKVVKNQSDLKNYFNKLKSCIEHHIEVLRFHLELQSIYSVQLMLQFLTTVPYLIVQISLSSEFSSFTSVIFLFSDVAWSVISLGLYCIPANQVSDELSTISDAAFKLDWYSQPFSFVPKSVILMIQRAQRRETFTACGLIEFNREVFVKILKFVMSTCIALRNIKPIEKL